MDGIGCRLSRRSAIVQSASSSECESSREGVGWRPSRRSAILPNATSIGRESSREGVEVRAPTRSAAARAPPRQRLSRHLTTPSMEERLPRRPQRRPPQRRDSSLPPPSMESSLDRTFSLDRDRAATVTPLPLRWRAASAAPAASTATAPKLPAASPFNENSLRGNGRVDRGSAATLLEGRGPSSENGGETERGVRRI